MGINLAWSRKAEHCIQCGTNVRRHRAKGLCDYCYDKEHEQKQKTHLINLKPKRGARKIPSKEQLLEDYSSGLSLADLARKYNFTRQYIYQILRKHRISRRTQREARHQAIDKGYLFKTKTNSLGTEERIFHEHRIVNEDFFKTWSPAMAYALGVLYSDGSISPSKDREERKTHKNRSCVCTISVSQKEPELLEKLLDLLESNALMQFRPKSGISGAVYSFRIGCDTMYDDLLRLGLTPQKSRTIVFPSMPHEYVRHFIRGCWDGDGSIYLEATRRGKPRSDFVSGSRDFVEGLVQQLCEEGLTKATVHTRKSGQSFYVKYGPQDCAKLYHLFYDGVDESIYLNRKYLRFKGASESLDRNEGAWLPFI